MSSNSFEYILIPSNTNENIISKIGNTSGGLQDDYLVKSAKEYFAERRNSTASAMTAMIDKASPEERKAIASQIRQNTPGCEKLDDDFLIQMFRTSQSQTSCEIHALVVPKASNGNIGVSMYSADYAKSINPPLNVNKRAMELMRACGHAISDSSDNAIRGDVFVGRYHDDEIKDIWKRIDFTIDDANPTSQWCIDAKIKGGGGSGSAPPSLSGMMAKANTATNNNSSSYNNAQEGEQEIQGDNGTYHWSQTNDDVELRFQVASGTKAKYVKVSFAPTTLKVTVAGQTLMSGNTGGKVAIDESTYTLEDNGNGKELTVTLGKKTPGLRWDFAVKSK